MSQIPAGAEGAVAGVMFYCCVCLIASSLMIWLTWTHHERTSHVAILTYFVTLSITASIVQQVHDIMRYRELVREQYENRKLHPHSPEVAISNASVGFSLVLYYIQYYCYNVEAMCVMFWAASLAQSVYGLSSRTRLKAILRRINRGGKIFAIIFPLTTILLLRIPQIQDTFFVFILLADLPLMLSLFFGCVLMIMILGRYVHSKRKFLHWSEDNPSGSTPAPPTSSMDSGPSKPGARRGIWDRWLMVRFTIAFVALSIFEVTNTLFQLQSIMNAQADYEAAKPEVSADRTSQAWVYFMPGVTPGLFIFMIFGTTTPLRRYMRDTFVPRRWRGGPRADSEAAVARRSFGDVPPTPPPKDFPTEPVSSNVVMTVVMSQEVLRSEQESARGPAEAGRSDSDEWPMLPIMKPTSRYARV